MAQPETPDAIELYERAVGIMRSILAGIRPEHLALATPCSEWNVQQLILHNLKGAECAYSLLTGGGFVNPMDVDGLLPTEGAATAFEATSGRVLELVKSPGGAEKIVEMPGMQVTAGQFLMQMFGDSLIHAWDLAKATGQDAGIDDVTAEVCYRMLEPQIDGGRQMGFFGPEVAMPDGAGGLDRLLGLTGRRR